LIVPPDLSRQTLRLDAKLRYMDSRVDGIETTQICVTAPCGPLLQATKISVSSGLKA
jgi:hypothetical protein